VEISTITDAIEIDVSHSFNSCIYALVDPKTDRIRYVGKSTSAETRYFQHISEAGRNKNKLYSWIKQLLKSDLFPKLYILEKCTEEQLSEKEKYWIKYLNDNGANLFNFGGKRHYHYSVKNLNSIANMFGGKLISQNISNSGGRPLEWLCLNGHGIFFKYTNEIVNGKWCSKCTKDEKIKTGLSSSEVANNRVNNAKEIIGEMLT